MRCNSFNKIAIVSVLQPYYRFNGFDCVAVVVGRCESNNIFENEWVRARARWPHTIGTHISIRCNLVWLCMEFFFSFLFFLCSSRSSSNKEEANISQKMQNHFFLLLRRCCCFYSLLLIIQCHIMSDLFCCFAVRLYLSLSLFTHAGPCAGRIPKLIFMSNGK